MIVHNTPVETHYLRDVPILVKREDLCSPYPGPSFSKMRGVYAHIKNRPEPVIGVLDTLHSKAGWCVAYVCSLLGKKCVNYWPRYNADPRTGVVRSQQMEAEKLGAKMVAIKAGRSAILYHAAKKDLAFREEYGDAGIYMMPNALKLPESVTENAAEALLTAHSMSLPEGGTLIISISSGTVAAGVLQGLERSGLLDNYQVVLHMGYSRSEAAARDYIEMMSGLSTLCYGLRVIDEGYGYADTCKKEFWEAMPFPSNPHYDAKAWQWLDSELASNFCTVDRDRPIVFWNIGS